MREPYDDCGDHTGKIDVAKGDVDLERGLQLPKADGPSLARV